MIDDDAFDAMNEADELRTDAERTLAEQQEQTLAEQTLAKQQEQCTMEGRLKKNQRLSEAEVLHRIRMAINDIAEDADDLATLHNLVAQSQLQFDPVGHSRDFVVVDEADANSIAAIAAEQSEDRTGK